MSNFKPWIDDGNVNVGTNVPANYAAESQRENGFASGQKVSSQLVNAALRSATLVSSALMNYFDPTSQLDYTSSESDVTDAINTKFQLGFVYGEYTGNATTSGTSVTQKITLGFKPSLLILFSKDALLSSQATYSGSSSQQSVVCGCIVNGTTTFSAGSSGVTPSVTFLADGFEVTGDGRTGATTSSRAIYYFNDANSSGAGSILNHKGKYGYIAFH